MNEKALEISAFFTFINALINGWNPESYQRNCSFQPVCPTHVPAFSSVLVFIRRSWRLGLGWEVPHSNLGDFHMELQFLWFC